MDRFGVHTKQKSQSPKDESRVLFVRSFAVNLVPKS